MKGASGRNEMHPKWLSAFTVTHPNASVTPITSQTPRRTQKCIMVPLGFDAKNIFPLFVSRAKQYHLPSEGARSGGVG